MKYLIIFLTIPLFIILPMPIVHAEVVEGKASVNVTTNTSVAGEGTVSTRIETTINGKTTIYESSEPGEHKINASSNDPNSSPLITKAPFTDTTATTTPSIKIKKDEAKTPFKTLSFLEGFSNFLKNLFAILTR